MIPPEFTYGLNGLSIYMMKKVVKSHCNSILVQLTVVIKHDLVELASGRLPTLELVNLLLRELVQRDGIGYRLAVIN